MYVGTDLTVLRICKKSNKNLARENMICTYIRMIIYANQRLIYTIGSFYQVEVVKIMDSFY